MSYVRMELEKRRDHRSSEVSLISGSWGYLTHYMSQLAKRPLVPLIRTPKPGLALQPFYHFHYSLTPFLVFPLFFLQKKTQLLI